ncbi:ABC transporter permease [Pokkaliibacter plantistimulans]|nr:ABC transporter permease [Pokkaliibacter plantistimulans]
MSNLVNKQAGSGRAQQWVMGLGLLVFVLVAGMVLGGEKGTLRQSVPGITGLLFGSYGIWLLLAQLTRWVDKAQLKQASGLWGWSVPALFALFLLLVWQMLVDGFAVPPVLLPSPTEIGSAFAGSLDMLWQDFRQTYLKSVLAGYIMGCGSGFIVALLIDRSPFMQKGLLPFGNIMSSIPIVGIAPIMVMWFGFDWQSKAAVVVIMTFFPMLVNTLSGLASAGKLEQELMRTYAASHVQSLLTTRLPYAMPFIFNALKLNSTLALIGAIVAEFFGTPIVGMGFRISTEVGRMNLSMVWATILVAALAGSISYGLLTLLERRVTFWHPSVRAGKR